VNKEFYKTSTSIGALLVLIGFILPWYSAGIISFSGYDIPKMVEIAKNISDSFSANSDGSNLYKLYYALYLFPILSIYLLYCEYSQTNKFKNIAKLSISLLMLILIFYQIIENNDIAKIIKFLGYGFFMTFAGSFYFTFKLIKEFKIDQNYLQKVFNTLKINILNWFVKNKKNITISSIIAVTAILLFSFIHKNSYDKVIIAFKNQNWNEVKLNYIQLNSDIADEKLHLNQDERFKIETIYSLTNKLELIENFKQKFKSIEKKVTSSFFPLNLEWTDLQYTNNDISDAEKADIDISQLQKIYSTINDDFKLSYAESIINDDMNKQFLKGNIEFNEKKQSIDKLISSINMLIDQVHDKKSTTVKKRIDLINKELSEYKKSSNEIDQNLEKSTFNLEPFTFNDKEGEFDNGYSENKKMFEEKKYIAYQSTSIKRRFIIYINNKKEVLELDENQDETYINKDYSLTMNFIKRLDDSPSEDQGEALYTLIVKNLKTNKEITKEVYCYCNFF
jgi:hypothetical protein